MLSIRSAAALADVNRKTIYRWLRAGLLEYRRLPSGSVRIFRESLLRVPRGSRRSRPESTRSTAGGSQGPAIAS